MKMRAWVLSILVFGTIGMGLIADVRADGRVTDPIYVPSVKGQSGKVLTNDGSKPLWGASLACPTCVTTNTLQTISAIKTWSGTQGGFQLGGQINGADSSYNEFFRYTPTLTANAKDIFTFGATKAFCSQTGGRCDQVYTLGPNLTPGGSRLLTGSQVGAMGLSFETYFEGSHHQMEGHWLYVDPADVQHRPITMLANLTSPYDINLMIGAQSLQLSGYDPGIGGSGGNVVMNSDHVGVQSPDLNTKFYADNNYAQVITSDPNVNGVILGFNKSGVLKALVGTDGSYDLQANATGVHGVGGAASIDFYNTGLARIQANGNLFDFQADGGLRHPAIAFASLGSPNNGTIAYCSDCTQTTTCAGSGSGAIAKRINGAWSCSDGGGVSSSSLQFSVVDMGTTNGATAGSGSFTTGHAFQVTESGCSITGVRFRWDGANHTIKASLFNSGGTNLQAATVTTTGAGVYTATFGTPQTPTAFTKYRVAMWENSGAQYEKFSATPNGAPISATTPPSPVINWEGPRMMIYSFNEFAAGDAAPSTGLTTNAEWYPVEPVFTCP